VLKLWVPFGVVTETSNDGVLDLNRDDLLISICGCGMVGYQHVSLNPGCERCLV
jgi:hypothetical protein